MDPEIYCYNLPQKHELLLQSIGDVFPDTFEELLAEVLFKVLQIDTFKNYISSLRHKVTLVDSDEPRANIGAVCVCRVTVKPTNENPEVKEINTKNFWNLDQHPKAIIVSSDSVNVIDSKLCVYKTFKNWFDFTNIRIHHKLDHPSTLGLFCAKRLTDNLTYQLKKLIECIPKYWTGKFVKETANTAFSLKVIEETCQNIRLVYEGRNIGSVSDDRYTCRAPWTIRRIKESLVSKALDCIANQFTENVLRRIVKWIAEKLEITLTDEIRRGEIFKNAKKFLLNSSSVVGGIALGDAVRQIVARVFNPTPGLIGSVVFATAFIVGVAKTVVISVNINSLEWRNAIAKEIHVNISSNQRSIINKIAKEIRELCINAKRELEKISHDLSSLSCQIPIIDQKKLIEEWTLRDFRIRDVESCPSILQFIAGRINGNPVMKVFVQGNENEAQTFCELNAENKPKDAKFEFVNVALLADSRNTALNKGRSYHIAEDEENHINNIIREERGKLFAKYSNVIAIGMSSVKYCGDRVVHEPCISIYCLDANLIPFGEEEIPKYLRGIACNIVEDFISFGSCENCQTLDHGCSIGKKGEKSSGTLGFFVQRKDHSDDPCSGFLTAAHVALKDDIIKTLQGKRLSESNFRNEVFDIVHPSFEDSEASKVIGKVKDSFFGNYESIGIDAAFIKTDDIQHELSDERSKQPFSFNNNSEEDKVVVKTGRTTGRTTGIWLRQCPLSVKRIPPRHKGVYFPLYECLCIENKDSKSFFEPGDSGAAVYVISEGNIHYPLGLAIGKTTSIHLPSITLACHIESILKVLNLSIFEPAQPMEVS
ncbi:uncharacterized protein LOC134242635 [Saccostrea cucullata]|uniref:uncharacterized protein LOC134242635 n=1 Tax=Saccostrea cuccullata TaxID=36930 RepID=UPI002ED66FE1